MTHLRVFVSPNDVNTRLQFSGHIPSDWGKWTTATIPEGDCIQGELLYITDPTAFFAGQQQRFDTNNCMCDSDYFV